MKPGQFLLLIIILVVSVIGVSHFFAPYPPPTTGAGAVEKGTVEKVVQPVMDLVDQKTAFERVMKTGVLRCGYYVFPPVTLRDLNTGVMSGLAVDLMNNIAEKTGLKIEWTEEVNFSNWSESLQAGRFDAVCTPMWPDMAQGRVALFTRPLFFAAISPLVRADDKRFESLADLNRPEVTFVGQDNSMLTALTREAFPKAQIRIMPASMDGPTVVQEVVTKKADAILLDKNALIEYNKRNTNKLKMIQPDSPVKGQAFALVTARENVDLHLFLDNAVTDLLATGTIDRLLTKWEPAPNAYMAVAKPYDE